MDGWNIQWLQELIDCRGSIPGDFISLDLQQPEDRLQHRVSQEPERRLPYPREKTAKCQEEAYGSDAKTDREGVDGFSGQRCGDPSTEPRHPQYSQAD